jgi:hypothetical protein
MGMQEVGNRPFVAVIIDNLRNEGVTEQFDPSPRSMRDYSVY